MTPIEWITFVAVCSVLAIAGFIEKARERRTAQKSKDFVHAA
jgi:hypothetical protein